MSSSKANKDTEYLDSYFEQVSFENSISKYLNEKQKTWMSIPNVTGYGVGFKRIKNRFTNKIGPIFFVNKKIQKNKLESDFFLPNYLTIGDREFQTDVVELSDFDKLLNYGDPQSNTKRYRPIEMGSSIGSFTPNSNKIENSGTAGVLVKNREDELFILSAGHVLSKVSNDLVQPENGVNRTIDSVFNDHVGTITAISGGDLSDFGIDAGIAKIDHASPNIISIGIPQQPLPPILSLNVQKSGMVTGLTFSSISYTNVTTFNQFTDQIDSNHRRVSGTGLFFVANSSIIIPNPRNKFPAFAMPGDSGSLIVAGWPNDTNNFGQIVTVMINDLQSTGQNELIPHIKNSLHKASLGLLIGVTTAPLERYSQRSSVYSFAQSYVIGQEIKLALDALNVMLVTSL